MSKFPYDAHDRLSMKEVRNIAYMDGPSIEQIALMELKSDDLEQLIVQCVEWSKVYPNCYQEYYNRGLNLCFLKTKQEEYGPGQAALDGWAEENNKFQELFNELCGISETSK